MNYACFRDGFAHFRQQRGYILSRVTIDELTKKKKERPSDSFRIARIIC